MSAIEFYRNNEPMLEQYLKMNGIKHISIFNDYDRGYGHTWSVWEMSTESGGWPGKAFDRKYKAVEYAKMLSEISGLPIK
jgi:hypothetical protein